MRKGCGKTLQRFGFEGRAEAMLGNGAGELVIDGPILDPASRQAREPENHAGKNGKKDGAAGDRDSWTSPRIRQFPRLEKADQTFDSR